MHRNKLILCIGIALLALTAFTGYASATFEYDLDVNNSGITGDVGTVDVTLSNGNKTATITFTLSDSYVFQGDNGNGKATAAVNLLSGGTGSTPPANWTDIGTGSIQANYGNFNQAWQASPPQQSSPVTFTLTNTTAWGNDGSVLGVNSKGYYAGVHFNFLTGTGFAVSDTGHEKTTTGSPVPEPTTLLLLGSGLVGLATFRKMSKRS